MTGELGNKIDSLWEIFWNGGITNPLDVVEQMTYLMFIPKQEDKMSALHAKVISVDQTDTLITSANLSYHGQEGNIELGARIHSKELAKQVEDIFTSLIFKRIFIEL